MVFNGFISVVNAQCGPTGTSAWVTYGNATATDECRLGTTTPQPLQIETNDTVRIQISKYGKVGIGYGFPYSSVSGQYSISPQALLHLHSFKYHSFGGGSNSQNKSLSAASTANSVVDFMMTNDQTGTNPTDGFKITEKGLNTFISNQENGTIYFTTNNTPNQLVLSKFGKTGVGVNPSGSDAKLTVFTNKESGLNVKTISATAPYGIQSQVRYANVPVFKGGLLTQNNITIYGHGQIAVHGNFQMPKWGSNWSVALTTPMESVWMTETPTTNGDYYGLGMTWNGWYFIKSKTNSQGQATCPMWLTSDDNETVLRVCGRIEAKKVKVHTGWCDYVFDNTYQPMGILQKEAYYKQYKHLPNVPTAKEVRENGADVGKALTGILQNVEENRLDITTLYKMVLVLQKENQQLKKQLEELK